MQPVTDRALTFAGGPFVDIVNILIYNVVKPRSQDKVMLTSVCSPLTHYRTHMFRQAFIIKDSRVIDDADEFYA